MNRVPAAPTAVVIPYFQREPGILRRALASVFAQQPPRPLRVLVVDDESPVPAARELAGLEPPAHVEVQLIHRRNGGPGAARNAGLDALDASIEHVAFLDSDDEWDAAHLARAHAVLAQGADAYFANFRQLGQSVGAFERAGRLDMARHRPLPGIDGGYLYEGSMRQQVIAGNVIGTPTVVYARRRLADVRFQPDLRSAGEDYLFWIALSDRGARWGFCTQNAATCGRGVNVYSGSGWGTDGHFMRLHHEARFRLALLRRKDLEAQERRVLCDKLAQVRLVMIRDLLHRVRRRKPVPLATLVEVARGQPALLALAPWLVVKAVVAR